jgi:uncharacterized repeat protein (TIGR01451 family)
MGRNVFSPRRGRRETRFRPSWLRVERLEERALLSPFMVMNTNDSGAGSLRQAILDSNAAPPPAGSINLIEFNIPPTDPGYQSATQTWTIAPYTTLPTVTAPVWINGYTQVGASANTNPPGMGKNTVLKIALSDLDTVVAVNCLTISAGSSIVSGLDINSFGIGIDLTQNGGDTISGNFIGTDVTGTHPAGSNIGVKIDSVGNVTIGGLAPGAGNVISGNLVGIESQQATLTATNDLVEGNFIGPDVTGTQVVSENSEVGVELANDSGDTIGGTTALAANLISGNAHSGISVGIGSQVSTDTVVEGNDLGTDVTGTMRLSGGISVPGGAAVELIGSGNTVGGAAAGAGNLIADNGYNAIEVVQGTGNLISRNAIVDNSPGGILVDQGANPGVTAPVLTTATVNPDGSVTVQGTLQNETPGDTLTIELFANGANPASGQPVEGQTFLTSTTAMADSSGNGSFSATVSPPAGEPFVTATATNSQNSTSAFRNALSTVPVGMPADITLSDNVDPGAIGVGSNLGYTFTVANQGTTMATGVTLTHMLPTSATFVSAVASQGTATQNAGVVTAQLGDLAGGASATVRVVVQPQTTGAVTIAASIHADQVISNPALGMTSIPVEVSPAAPTNVVVQVVTGTGGSAALALTWSAMNPPGSGVTFNVYRAESPGGEGTTPYATGITADQYTDAGAVPGHVYYYEVAAISGGLESLHATEAIGTILAAPTLTADAMPADVTGTPMVNLTWSDADPALSALTYQVTASGSGSGGGGNTVVYRGTNRSTTVSQLPNSTVDYQVSAVVGTYTGPPSAPVPATTLDLKPLSIGENDPSGPTLLQTGLAQYQLTIAWEEPYSGASSVSYDLYLSTAPLGADATPYRTGIGVSLGPSEIGGGGGGGGCSGPCGGGGPIIYQTYVDQPPGTTYYYAISEVLTIDGQSYMGPRSNEIALTTPAPMLRQINVESSKGPHKRATSDIVLDFSSPLNAADAQNTAAYQLVTLGKRNKKTGHQATKPVKLASATYNPTTKTVTLAVKGTLPNQPLQLSVNTSAVLDASGQPIAGSSGQAGGTLQETFGKKGIIL